MTRTLPALALTLLAACSGGPAADRPGGPHPALAATARYGTPAPPTRRPFANNGSDFNDYLLDAARGFGTASYLWEGDGVTRELRYQGELIASPHAPSVCHCVGATLQVYFAAFEAFDARFGGAAGVMGGLSVAQVKQLKQVWFVSTDDLTGSRGALTSLGLGTGIDDPHQAQGGDLVQIWRNNGSGHSVVLDRFDFDAAGQPSAITYFSCQSDGAGFNTEPIGAGARDVDPARIHVAHPAPPVPVPADAGPSVPPPVDQPDAGPPVAPPPEQQPPPQPSPTDASGSCALASTADADAGLAALLLALALALILRIRRSPTDRR